MEDAGNNRCVVGHFSTLSMVYRHCIFFLKMQENLTSLRQVPIPYPNASVGAGYPAAPPNVTRSLRKGY